MMSRNNMMRFLGLAGIVGTTLLCNISKTEARENIPSTNHLHKNTGELKTTAAQCQPATAAMDMQINNVRARLMTGGDMWWNLGTQAAEYEIPKGSGKSSQFAASCWIGGFDQQGQLKVAAQTYRQDGNDYWPGILDNNAQITSDACGAWDQFWLVDKSTINDFIQAYNSGASTTDAKYDAIKQWPGSGNSFRAKNGGSTVVVPTDRTYAPFVDLNHDGIYQPGQGEYPALYQDKPESTPDEMVWWVFNDAGNAKQQSKTAAMGIEVQTTAFAYSSQDFLNDATFCNYRVINRGQLTIDSTFIAVWDDCDLGYAFDDFIGCDTTRGLGIQYNGKSVDGEGEVNSYGSDIPQVGLDFFQGPKKVLADSTVIVLPMTNFTYYNNDYSAIGNPSNGTQIYYYMTGSISDGTRFSDDFKGPGIPSVGYGNGPISHFIYWGDPGDNSQWSECACNNNPNDRRFIFSSGPFTLLPNVVNDITFGCIWTPGVGGCPKTNFKTITAIDDNAQALFDAGFKKLQGPDAPNLVIRELDKRLIFYIENPYGSNNYKEQYGNVPAPGSLGHAATQAELDSAEKYNESSVKASKIVNSADSLYKFQGYRVFQLANSSVSAADVFDPTTGEVNTDKAYEVFQCDVRDSVTRIINYTKNTAISDTTWIPQIKIANAKDSGIAHTFELTQNQFASGSDKSLVNYQNYYYVAIAYSYNDFSYNKTTHKGGFDPKNEGITQDVPYLASTYAANGTPIQVITGMPNPANGEMGTVLNSDYGSGVVIHRLEGTGNGGNFIQLDSASEATAVSSGAVGEAIYQPGYGPVEVKIVDPVKVVAADWQLYISGPNSVYGIDSNQGSWKLVSSNGDVIMNEDKLSVINEQILAEFGLSVSITQVLPPGVDEVNGNGYLSSDITFADASKPWLAGVQDQSDSNIYNWIRSGNNTSYKWPSATSPCNFNDNKLDTNLAYENMFANFSPTKSTWAPYALTAPWLSNYTLTGTYCGFTLAYNNQPLTTAGNSVLSDLPSVNLVFTSDTSKWTRCLVIETQEDSSISQGHAAKFYPRKHRGWNKDLNADGTPIYSTAAADSGFSWFPGYAINEETGQRLNIVFGEDSWKKGDNGADMIWDPTSTLVNTYDGSIVFGGKHYTYVLSSPYDKGALMKRTIDSSFHYSKNTADAVGFMTRAYRKFAWAGLPTLNVGSSLLPLSEGLIPTETTLRFRVSRPYAAYDAHTGTTGTNGILPTYMFTTKGLAPTPATDATVDKKSLLDRIFAVPNPYYGYSGYEQNRFDTKVRIINLPANATINIYSLDGSLIRTLTKSGGDVSYIDWDIRNTAGLPIASGMYLMDVKAEGIGETVLRWFGAMRPIDITTY